MMEAAQRLGGETSQASSGCDPVEAGMLRAAAYNRTPGGLPGKDCPECLNKGQIMVVHEDGSTAIRECGCMGWRRSLKRLERSGLKELVKRCRFETFQVAEPWQEAAKREAERYAEDPAGRWFLASGQPGSGKTHLCVAICRELMLRGMEVRYLLWRDAVTRLKAAVNDSEEYARLMEPLKRVAVLYIDDFFKTGRGQQPTVGDVNVAFELLNARYLSGDKLTVISTERSVEELLDIDEAVGSRIYERSKGCGLLLVGENKNWRMRA